MIPTLIQNKLSNVKCLICDVDGVLSNGILYLTNHGDEIKTFHVHDGIGLKLLMCADIHVAIITTSKNNIIDNRMKQLGIQHYYSGYKDKKIAFEDLKSKLDLANDDFAYISDDLPDIPVMEQVGLKVAVANARSEVISIADIVTKAIGGHGAVRELADMILNQHQLKDSALESYIHAAS